MTDVAAPLLGLAGLGIGNGPAHSLVGSVIMVLLGGFFAVGAFARGTRLRGAFMYGKGPSVPISTAGRVILFLIALTLLIAGVRGLVV